jgi:hypothetical protein
MVDISFRHFSCCLSALLSLSPDLLSLVTDDVVDVAAYERLLHVGFSIPSFEQVCFYYSVNKD